MKKTAYLTTLAIITVACIILGSVYHIGGWVGFGIGTFFDFILLMMITTILAQDGTG